MLSRDFLTRAVGGTINEADHVFGLSAAKKYGGIYVPTHMAVIHQYARENIFLPGIRNVVENGSESVGGWLINGVTVSPLNLSIPDLTEKDRDVLLAGNLINYHAAFNSLV